MTKQWGNIFRIVILIIGIMVLAFNAVLYIVCKQQRNEIDTLSDQQKTESQIDSNKFKYQQDQIEHLSKELDEAQQQIKDQNDALLQEVEKRQQVEDDNKDIRPSIAQIKTEEDAIKQEMKGWQKDYVSVLAELNKKMDNAQYEIKSFEDNLAALNIPELKENISSLKSEVEKMTPPGDNSKNANQT